jgi:DNA-binding response OmpR family regulator
LRSTTNYLQKDDDIVIKNDTTNRILVIDDVPDICLLYQLVLRDAGYECISYTDPLKALQGFRPDCYDLILLDIKMPVLDGFELCKKVIEQDKTVKIIFITASEKQYNKIKEQNYPELESIISIQKPIRNEELVKAVNSVISTKDTN